MEACDTVFFLDMPVETCLEGVESRRGKPRTDMPWVETEADEEFIAFISSFIDESRPKIIELLDSVNGKTVVKFKNRAQIAEFLGKLQEK